MRPVLRHAQQRVFRQRGCETPFELAKVVQEMNLDMLLQQQINCRGSHRDFTHHHDIINFVQRYAFFVGWRANRSTPAFLLWNLYEQTILAIAAYQRVFFSQIECWQEYLPFCPSAASLHRAGISGLNYNRANAPLLFPRAAVAVY